MKAKEIYCKHKVTDKLYIVYQTLQDLNAFLIISEPENQFIKKCEVDIISRKEYNKLFHKSENLYINNLNK